MYLLDTNVVSELRRCSLGKGDESVTRWASFVASEQLYISAIVLLEIEVGILRKERKDPAQGEILRRWKNEKMLPAFEHKILAFDDRAAMKCAPLHVPDPKSYRDAMIAATAMTHDMTVVTRNVDDFKGMKVKVYNPWLFPKAHD